MRVLIAEDSDIERMILQEAVEGLGHECVTAADGNQAWDIFQRSGADVLISDWRMPGLEGPELYRALRERYPDRPPRVIFMSANTGIDEYATFLAETGEPALEKPFNLTDIRQVVLQVLTQVRRAAGTE